MSLSLPPVTTTPVSDDQSLLGSIGRVTVSIPANGPGEVLLSVRGGSEAFAGCGRRRVFAGHLRSIVGGLTVEQIIRERDRVAQEVKDGSHAEMEKLGIVVDALEIQEIEDASGYINNLAAPHAAGEVVTGLIGQGLSILDTLRKSSALTVPSDN